MAVAASQNGDLPSDSMVIHQAIGMVMGQLDVGGDMAADRLHEHATRTRRALIDVAKDVVARRLNLAEPPL